MDFDRIPDIAKYLSAIFFLAYIGRNTVWKFLPLYFNIHIESVFLVGVIMALPSTIPILLDIPAGNLVQRSGEKIVIFLGIVFLVFPGLFYLTAVPFMLALGKIIEGISKTLVWNGGWSLALQSPDNEVESESISIFRLGIKFTGIVGPLTGGYIIAAYGFGIPLWLWFFTALVSVPVFYFYVGVERKQSLHDSILALGRRSTYRDDWEHIRENWESMRLPLGISFLYSIIISFFWLAVPLLLDEIGAGLIVMGVIFGLSAVPGAFSYFFGKIADIYGTVFTIAAMNLLAIPLLIGMGVSGAVLVVGALFLGVNLLMQGVSPAIHALFDERVPDEVEGELTGVLELFKHSGQTIGPLLGGVVASVWSINASFFAAALVSLGLFITSLLCLIED